MTITWPAALPAHATIGICSPASPVRRDRLIRGIRALRALGHRVKLAPHALARQHMLAGADAARLADLMDLWADPEVDAILCSRGGYGTMRLLPSLDWDLIASRPLPFAGYSDITALANAIFARTGLVTFSAPMAADTYGFGRPGGIDAGTAADFWRWLRPEPRPMPLTNPDGSAFELWRAGPAVVEGPLLGGNLTLLACLLGTPYAPPLDGAVLALEDVGEQPYTVDRMLTQLALAGVLDRVGALLLGDFDHCFPPHTSQPGPTLREVVDSCLGDRPITVLGGVLHGHIAVRSTLPLGAWTRVTTHPPAVTIDPTRRQA